MQIILNLKITGDTSKIVQMWQKNCVTYFLFYSLEDIY